MRICTNTPLPSLDEILKSFQPSLKWPPVLPKLPEFAFSIVLPQFPSPILGSLNIPNLELVMTAIELQAVQLMSTVMAIVKPVLSKLGIAIKKFLPKIPGLPGLDLVDLLSSGRKQLIEKVKKALERGFTLAMLPYPMYPTLKIPDLEAAHALQAIVANYMFIVIEKVAGIVKKVTKSFRGMKTPSFPSFPTPEQILMAIISKIPGLPAFPNYAALLEFLKEKFALPEVPSISDVLQSIEKLQKNIDISALLAKIKLPSMPAFPKLPNPLIPSFNIPDIELALNMLAFNINLQLGLLKPIIDFIKKTLSKKLTFKFPTLCITIPVPNVKFPEISARLFPS